MKPSPFHPVDDSDFQLYHLFRDEVFPLRQRYQDFEDGKYFPSEAAATLLVKTASIFDHIDSGNAALLFNTEQILSAFISATESTMAAFDRALATFAQLVRPKQEEKDGEGIIVIDDSDDDRARRKAKGKGKEKQIYTGKDGHGERSSHIPDVQFLKAIE